jgi:hypothetical protein
MELGSFTTAFLHRRSVRFVLILSSHVPVRGCTVAGIVMCSALFNLSCCWWWHFFFLVARSLESWKRFRGTFCTKRKNRVRCGKNSSERKYVSATYMTRSVQFCCETRLHGVCPFEIASVSEGSHSFLPTPAPRRNVLHFVAEVCNLTASRPTAKAWNPLTQAQSPVIRFPYYGAGMVKRTSP